MDSSQVPVRASISSAFVQTPPAESGNKVTESDSEMTVPTSDTGGDEAEQSKYDDGLYTLSAQEQSRSRLRLTQGLNSHDEDHPDAGVRRKWAIGL